MELTKKIEAVLLFKNEPMSVNELSKCLNESKENIKEAINNLQSFYADRGLVIVFVDDQVSFGTYPDASELIEGIQKDELSKDLGRAGLETLSIILYKSPVSRREIDYIRGVSSGFIIRNLLIRGLIERSESKVGERSFSYKPTVELFKFLGITKAEDLPEYKDAFSKIEQFAKTIEEQDDHT